MTKREGVVPVWLDLPKYVHLFQGPRTFVRSMIIEERKSKQERKKERQSDTEEASSKEQTKRRNETIFKDHL